MRYGFSYNNTDYVKCNPPLLCGRKVWHKTVASVNSPVPGVMHVGEFCDLGF